MSFHCKGWNGTAIYQRGSSAAIDLILIKYLIPWSGLCRDAHQPRRLEGDGMATRQTPARVVLSIVSMIRLEVGNERAEK